MRLNINKLEALDDRIERLTIIIVIYSLSLMLLLVFFQVVIRDLFGISMYGINELARYLLVSFSFLSGYLALKRGELVGITFAVNALPIKARRWADLIRVLLIIIFLVVGIFYGVKLAVFILKTGQLSPSLQIPIGFVYLPVPLGFLLMLSTSLISACDLILGCSLKKHVKDKQTT